jgi:hypothetical protein
VWWAGNEAVLQDVIWCEWIKRERENNNNTNADVDASGWDLLEFLGHRVSCVCLCKHTGGGHGWWTWLVGMVGGHGWWAWYCMVVETATRSEHLYASLCEAALVWCTIAKY